MGRHTGECLLQDLPQRARLNSVEVAGAASPPSMDIASDRASALPGGGRGSVARRLRRRRRAARQHGCQSPPSAPIAETCSRAFASEANPYSGLMAQLDAGGRSRQVAVENIRGSVLSLALDRFGCRVVQLAIQVAERREATLLILELHGHVCEAIRSAHANYVIQKVVQVMPVAITAFIVEELMGVAVWAVRHRFGCRIVCRLLEHHTGGEETGERIVPLISKALEDAVELCRSTFGHYVMLAILEHGSPTQRRAVAGALLEGGVVRNASSRHASHVILKALDYCCPEYKSALTEELLRNSEHFSALAECQSGSRVLRALLSQQGDCSKRAAEVLRLDATKLRTSKYGRQVLEDLPLEDWQDKAPLDGLDLPIRAALCA